MSETANTMTTEAPTLTEADTKAAPSVPAPRTDGSPTLADLRQEAQEAANATDRLRLDGAAKSEISKAKAAQAIAERALKAAEAEAKAAQAIAERARKAEAAEAKAAEAEAKAAQAEAEHARKAAAAEAKAAQKAEAKTPVALTPHGGRPLEPTEDANATWWASRQAETFRYYADAERWLAWNGHVWEADAARTVVESARRKFRAMHTQAQTEDEAKLWAQHRAKTLTSGGIAGMLSLARSDGRLVVRDQHLDAHPWDLNTPGGVFDLATGEMTPSDPLALHTRTTLVTPSPDCPTPAWDRFLKETFGGDEDTIEYVRRLFGYSITGDVSAQLFPYWDGDGGNGKGVLAEIMIKLLGRYAGTVPRGFLAVKKGETHPTEIADLKGLRFVMGSETNAKDEFDEAKVKLLTGGDRLKARRMGQDFFEFDPTHKLHQMGNYKPRVSDGGRSFWRRMRVIPFHNHPAKVIADLADTIVQEEGPGVLWYLITGARDLRAEGIANLTTPPAVQAATDAYRYETENIRTFIAEACHVPDITSEAARALCTVTAEQFDAAYRAWCYEESYAPMDSRVYGKILSEMKIEKKRSGGQKARYIGISLLSSDSET